MVRLRLVFAPGMWDELASTRKPRHVLCHCTLDFNRDLQEVRRRSAGPSHAFFDSRSVSLHTTMTTVVHGRERKII